MLNLGLGIKLVDGYGLVVGHFVRSSTKNENRGQLCVLFQKVINYKMYMEETVRTISG